MNNQELNAAEEYYKFIANVFKRANAEDEVLLAGIELFKDFIGDPEKRVNISLNQIIAIIQTAGKLKNDYMVQLITSLTKKDGDAAGLLKALDSGKPSETEPKGGFSKEVKDAAKVKEVVEAIEAIANSERQSD